MKVGKLKKQITQKQVMKHVSDYLQHYFLFQVFS